MAEEISLETICFIDLGVALQTGKICAVAALCGNQELKTTSLTQLREFIERCQPLFLCGHNFINHDAAFLDYSSLQSLLHATPIIDTLYLSMLLFPTKTTHKLDKPYKTELNIENDPLGDCRQTRELLSLLVAKFNSLAVIQQLLVSELLAKDKYFSGFFKLVNLGLAKPPLAATLAALFKIPSGDILAAELVSHRVELAIAVIYLAHNRHSLSPVILHCYPQIVTVLQRIYSFQAPVNLEEFSQREFGIGSFRSFPGLAKNDLLAPEYTISQLDIVSAALTSQSLLVILPTGGGKTFTFQLPALVKASGYRGLTVVISPLQALMKNHVDGFKSHNFVACAISGYLSPLERMDALEQVASGCADIVYLAPEALRSNSIIKVLKRRIIERFVIDEAHCFSAWGHDFRHDYNYIATVIAELQQQPFQPSIPVSCFTATAKPEVLDDIKKYFHDKLSLQLTEFIAKSERSNLDYRVVKVNDDKEKYEQLVRELERLGNKATIIYRPQNARGCRVLAEQLNHDPRIQALKITIEPFYAKIDDEIERGARVGRDKSQILSDFIDDRVNVVVATTAFGMGIDKPNIEAVIHYDPSDSIEAYMQEAGRGARREDIAAECILFFVISDFNRIFTQLNRNKLDYEEILQVVREFKKEKKSIFYPTAQELAEKMGIDSEDSALDADSIIKTAILELEKAEVISRGRDSTKIYATSIKSTADKSPMEYVHEILDPKKLSHYPDTYELMVRIMQNVIQRSKVEPIELTELALVLGSETRVVFQAVADLQREGLLDYDNDISIMITKGVTAELNRHFEFENQLLELFSDNLALGVVNLREINRQQDGNNTQAQNRIKLARKIIKSWLRLSAFRDNSFKPRFNQDICRFQLENLKQLRQQVEIRAGVCRFIVATITPLAQNSNEVEVCVNQIFHQFLSQQAISLEGFHHCLVYLHELVAGFKLRKGRLLYHRSFQIQKLAKLSENRPYQKRAHYNESLVPYYQRKIEAIHILIKLLQKILSDSWQNAKNFVADYFSLAHNDFKTKHGLNERQLQLAVTHELHQQILADLNDEQQQIVNDKTNQAILVLAGPGSGKTKTLVHKIANLITIEQHKPEYFLMLAHSRVAVAEFRERLLKLIGNDAYAMEIITFHALAVKIVGKELNNDNELNQVISGATQMLRNGYVLPLKTLVVLDEYQDVSLRSYQFIQAIYQAFNKECRIIAVGDDDQCINNFPGADGANIRFMNSFANDFGQLPEGEELLQSTANSEFAAYSLTRNYRSKANLVEFSSAFARNLPKRLKTQPLQADRQELGQINIYRYSNNDSLINAAVSAIIQQPMIKCALLLRTNEEVLTAFSLFQAAGIKARYLTDNEGFNLGQLAELQDFLEHWRMCGKFSVADDWLRHYSAKSQDLPLALEIIERFYDEYEEQIARAETHFMDVFSDYLREIEFGEFNRSNCDIVVATMHKAKGKEFTNVYVVVNSLPEINDFELRLIYVALTRARYNLYIYTASNIFDNLAQLANQYVSCENLPPSAIPITYLMGLGDVYLGNSTAQKGISQTKPLAGEQLQIVSTNNNSTFTISKNAKEVARLSRPENNLRLSYKLQQKLASGYLLDKSCTVEHVVKWLDSNKQQVYYQVLCQIRLLPKI